MIDVRQVTKYYGSFRAVNNLSFSIEKGEIVGLLGPNGAGKTTTMRMITGYLEPTSGTIEIAGETIAQNPRGVKRKIGYLPESAPLYNDMLVLDYLTYAARIQGVEDLDYVLSTAKTCGLYTVMHKGVGELSRGYRQRVGLAYAMLHDPEILVLDEPTSGLDPNQIIEVRNLIKEVGREKTVIISTHILPEVEMLCDRVIIVSDGVIAADEKTSQLQVKYGHSASLRVAVGSASFAELEQRMKAVDGVESVAKADIDEAGLTAVLVGFRDGAEIRPGVSKAVADAGWPLYEMAMQKNTLEDVFRDLTLGGAK
ncbi:MAG: ATP-binding cassette domain-containing protein [Spirochaetales bacterium]|nr:ATP-binding cassette domain-containing protein [Spirochaetales bacterium]